MAASFRGANPSVLKMFRSLNWQRFGGKLWETERLLSNGTVLCFLHSHYSIGKPRATETEVKNRSRVRTMSTIYVTSSKGAGDLHILGAAIDRNRMGLQTFQAHRHASIMPPKRSGTHYYDILGLNPNATQNQIKSAYYEKSKLHHPDVTECTKSHSLFTEINEAYEVLGNIQKRRLYDRGAYSSHTFRPGPASAQEEEADYTEAYRERSPFERGNRPPPPRGRTRVYNFDEFYRQHYNDIRERKARDMDDKFRYEQMMSQRKQMQYLENRMLAVGMSLFILLFAMFMLLEHDYDRDTLRTFRTSTYSTSSGGSSRS